MTERAVGKTPSRGQKRRLAAGEKTTATVGSPRSSLKERYGGSPSNGPADWGDVAIPVVLMFRVVRLGWMEYAFPCAEGTQEAGTLCSR